MSDREHWEAVHARKSPEQVTWYQPHLNESLRLVRSCGLAATARIVDVGGGSSTLVDDLLHEGHQDLAVIDLAENALQTSRSRLGPAAEDVQWIVGDATTTLLPDESVDLWHDRAVFHFLTEARGRQAYREQLLRCLKPGGHVLISTFAADGPDRCSGLPTVRYDPDDIVDELGEGFEKVAEARETHHTPSGGTQQFAYCLMRRR